MQKSSVTTSSKDPRLPPGMRRCRHCGCVFTSYHNNPRQHYCGRADCQRKRKSRWRREKYIPLSELRQEKRDEELARCREAMRRLRRQRRKEGQKILMEQAVEESVRQRVPVLFRGLASFLVGSEEPHAVGRFLEEAERRGLSLSCLPAARGP